MGIEIRDFGGIKRSCYVQLDGSLILASECKCDLERSLTCPVDVHQVEALSAMALSGLEESGLEEKKVRTSDTMEYLPVYFTAEERLELGQKLSTAMAQMQQEEDRKRIFDLAYKDTIGGLELSAKSIARRLHQGFDLSDVACEIQYDTPSPGKKTIVRKDTGDVLRVIPMQGSDFQEELPLTATAAESHGDVMSATLTETVLDRAVRLDSDNRLPEGMTLCDLHGGPTNGKPKAKRGRPRKAAPENSTIGAQA